MSASPDKFVLWDAAYVLRALSPAERSEFEEHLADCAVCQAAVAELAAIPDQLASLSFADATTFRRAWRTPTLGPAEESIEQQDVEGQ